MSTVIFMSGSHSLCSTGLKKKDNMVSEKSVMAISKRDFNSEYSGPLLEKNSFRLVLLNIN